MSCGEDSRVRDNSTTAYRLEDDPEGNDEPSLEDEFIFIKKCVNIYIYVPNCIKKRQAFFYVETFNARDTPEAVHFPFTCT